MIIASITTKDDFERWGRGWLDAHASLDCHIVFTDCQALNIKEVENGLKVNTYTYQGEQCLASYRNFLHEKVKGLILWVDMDERVIKLPNVEGGLAYTMNIINYEKVNNLMETVRIVDSSLRYEGYIHENVDKSLNGRQVERTQGLIEHFGYMGNLKEKIQRNITLSCLEILKGDREHGLKQLERTLNAYRHFKD